jgi:uncharacterized membrane-anchored protein
LSILTIFTRPLGASFGDLLSQSGEYGEFGFGTTVTSAIFLAANRSHRDLGERHASRGGDGPVRGHRRVVGEDRADVSG